MNTAKHKKGMERDKGIYVDIDGVFGALGTRPNISTRLEAPVSNQDYGRTREALRDVRRIDNIDSVLNGFETPVADQKQKKMRKKGMLMAPSKPVKAISRIGMGEDNVSDWPVRNLLSEFNDAADTLDAHDAMIDQGEIDNWLNL